MKKLFIIGVGVGSVDCITLEAKDIILSCDNVYALSRIGESLKSLNKYIKIVTLSEILSLDLLLGKSAILVTGDTGFFSIASKLAENVRDTSVTFVPGVSSLQYFSAQLGISYENVYWISLHGREKSILPAVTYNPQTFALSGGKYKAQDICRELTSSGLGSLDVFVGEDLSLPTQRIIKGKAYELAKETFSNLAVLFINNPLAITKGKNYKDTDFIRGKAPMTKEEVRFIISAKMDISKDDTLWDIGAGTGSVAIDMASKAWDSLVYAVEKDEESFNLIKENIAYTNCYNVVGVKGTAPKVLNELPPPDKVFIGGSSGNIKEIAKVIGTKNPKAFICVTSITLETLTESLDIFNEPSVVCVNIARNEKVGKYNMMKAGNPIYIITGYLDEKYS